MSDETIRLLGALFRSLPHHAQLRCCEAIYTVYAAIYLMHEHEEDGISVALTVSTTKPDDGDVVYSAPGGDA